MRIVAVALFVALACGFPAAAAAPVPQPVYLLHVHGAVLPIVATYLDRAVGVCEQDGAICVIALDTPGGLMDTTQVIVQRFLAARVPIVVYVSPAGAWAGSAGVFMTYAANVAAMAPGTNIGAAHPVTLGGGGGEAPKGGRDIMAEKLENHMASYIRTIAQQRHRNAAWGEKAVRKSVSLTASEAQAQGVVDLVATDLPDLLRQLKGREVEVAGAKRVLHPAAQVAREISMTWAERFLSTITHPGLAAFLIMFGLLGITYELMQPGAVLPGVVGAICLLLGAYAVGQLPINYAGLGLMLLAVVLFIADLKLAAHGVLTLGAIVAMVLGAVLLVPSGYPYLAVSWSAIAALTVVVGGGFMLLAVAVATSMKRRPITGASAMVGARGVAVTGLDPEGEVRVGGELWKARTARPPIAAGSAVRVAAVNDLTLLVEPAQEGGST